MNVHRILSDAVAEVVGLTVAIACLHAAARHPPGETAAMVIAPKPGLQCALRKRRAAELAAEDDQGIFQ